MLLCSQIVRAHTENWQSFTETCYFAMIDVIQTMLAQVLSKPRPHSSFKIKTKTICKYQDHCQNTTTRIQINTKTNTKNKR